MQKLWLAWKTVRHDWPKLLKVPLSSESINLPPNICIPRSAKMKMKRMRRTSSALMEAMELTRLFTKLPILAQYLKVNIDFNVGKGNYRIELRLVLNITI